MVFNWNFQLSASATKFPTTSDFSVVETNTPTLKLCRTRLDLIECGGRLCQMLGLPRSTGQIYGLLYLAPTPLALDDIVEFLQISKASASNGTRQLSPWNAIHQVWVQGQRRDHYEVIADLSRLIQGIYSEFLKPRLRNSERRLSNMLLSLDEDVKRGDITQAEHELIATRLNELGKMQKKIEKWLPLAEQLL